MKIYEDLCLFIIIYDDSVDWIDERLLEALRVSLVPQTFLNSKEYWKKIKGSQPLAVNSEIFMYNWKIRVTINKSTFPSQFSLMMKVPVIWQYHIDKFRQFRHISLRNAIQISNNNLHVNHPSSYHLCLDIKIFFLFSLSSNVKYKYECSNCSAIYCGKISRNQKIGWIEHLGTGKNGSKLASPSPLLGIRMLGIKHVHVVM